MSWKFKWTLLIAYCPSVSLFVCVLDFYIFDFYSRTVGPTLAKVSTMEFKIVQMKVNLSLREEIIAV
jgi:hypothetical protein